MSAAPTLSRLEIVRKDAWIPDNLRAPLKRWSPKSDLGKFIAACILDKLPADMAAELIDRFSRIVVIQSSLDIKCIRGPESLYGRPGEVEDYGIVGDKVVTTAGVNFLVAAWQNTVEMEILKFHALGTGVTAEANGDTLLVTELTTEYNPDSTRATGSLTVGGSNNIFRTIGTNTLDGTPGAALREHGIFSVATAATITLWDRTLFSAITLSSGDGLQSTYDCTCSAGG